jgi:hypothetical protein
MRIARLCSAAGYLPFFEEFFENSRLGELSYDDALGALRANGYLYPGTLHAGFAQRGSEILEFIPDFPSLQRLWARQHGRDAEQVTALVLAQLYDAQPDIVYFHEELAALPRAARLRLREEIPGLRAVVAFKGDPVTDCTEFGDLDLVFCTYQAFRAAWERAGVRTHLLPHCYDPSVAPVGPTGDVPPLVFVGTTGYGNVSHGPRYHGLARLLEETGIEIWGLEHPGANWKDHLRPHLTWGLRRLPVSVLSRRAGDAGYVPRLFQAALDRRRGDVPGPWYLHERPLAHRFPGGVHPAVYAEDYAALLAGAKIVVNLHTDHVGEAGNMRCFEVTGAGACLLTDRADEMTHLFEPGVEIASFKTIDEAIAQTRRLLADEGLRAEIARRGQIRTLRDHTTEQRCGELHAVLEDLLA